MARSKPVLTRWAIMAATAAGFVVSATHADAQDLRPRSQIGSDAPRGDQSTPDNAAPSYFRPKLGVQAMVTDNVYLSPSSHVTDLVTSLKAGVEAAHQGPRLDAMMSLDVGYDSYSRAHQLNGFSISAFGSAGYEVIQRFLSLEADGAVTNGNSSTFGSPAITRSGFSGRTQVAEISAGPRLTTTVGDLLDVQARARVGWVGYSAADGSDSPNLPEDTALGTVDVLATTGDRYGSHEVSTLFRYAADEHDFRLYSGVASLFVNVSPDFRLIARGGYDDISQGGAFSIKSPVWSGGFEYDLNTNATFRLEAGRRYHDTSFVGEAFVEFTDQFYALGRYNEQILPPQISLNSSFLNFVSDARTLPAPLLAQSFSFFGGLQNETSKQKTGELRLAYAWPTQELSLTANWLGRHLLVSDTREESLGVILGYERNLRPDLRGGVSVEYGRTLQSLNQGDSRYVRGLAQLSFQFTPTVQIVGGYAYSNDRRTAVTGSRIIENVAFASVTKSF